ncbi:MAG: hypothetical protein E6J14_06635 [Chloroflexi bacterium]|nr:MAG: hypothetical protein E6J14_06635 [Chloroflexota bacterium]
MVVLLVTAGTFGVSAQAASHPSNAVSHHPRVTEKGGHGTGGGGSGLGWASSNWSGYAVTGTTYSSVTGGWTVPTVSATSGATYSSAWVGIDGFGNTSLIQTGTEQDYYGGAAHYAAWWEILPASVTFIPACSVSVTTNCITVSHGDTMAASISKGVSGWSITLTDSSNGNSFTTTGLAYAGPGTSAEWIVEAPTVGGRLATLARYGSTVFDHGTANGASPALVKADGGVMIQRHGSVSTPSSPDSPESDASASDGFAIAYGSSAPAAPSS